MSDKLKGLDAEFDTGIIPWDFDLYKDISFDYMLEVDENIFRIEYILDQYKLKKKHKKLLYNIMGNIQKLASDLEKYKEDHSKVLNRNRELEKEISGLRAEQKE